jgi:hypothetical protein
VGIRAVESSRLVGPTLEIQAWQAGRKEKAMTELRQRVSSQDGKSKQETNMKEVFAVIGSVFFIYFGIRIFATGVDIFQRWRSGNWEA